MVGKATPPGAAISDGGSTLSSCGMGGRDRCKDDFRLKSNGPTTHPACPIEPGGKKDHPSHDEKNLLSRWSIEHQNSDHGVSRVKPGTKSKQRI